MSELFMRPYPPGAVNSEINFSKISVAAITWVWDSSSVSREGILDCDCLVLKLRSAAIGLGTRVGESGYLVSPVKVGDLSFWPAGTRIRAEGLSGVTRNFRCAFHDGWLNKLLGIRSGSRNKINLTIQNQTLHSLMLRLLEEVSAPGFNSNVMIEGLGLQILAELSRHLRNITPVPANSNQQLTPWQIKRVQRHFESFSGYLPDTSDLATLCGVSERHFRRLFKETMGRTVSEFARSVWSERAKMLFDVSEAPINNIANQLGFSSPNGLSMAFKKATGQTPTEYRQRLSKAVGNHPHKNETIIA